MNDRDQEIRDAQARLEQNWDSDGDCGSCGWHALLSEHDVSDDDIAYALDNGGWLELGCRSKDADDADTHRGVRIFIGKAVSQEAAERTGGAE